MPYQRSSKWVFITGLLLLAFGLGCLNYTKAAGLDHHREVAARYGLPPPSESILHAGAISLIVGAGLIGFAIGRRTRRPEPTSPQRKQG